MSVRLVTFIFYFYCLKFYIILKLPSELYNAIS